MRHARRRALPEEARRPLRVWLGSRLATVVLVVGGAVAVDGTTFGWSGFLAAWNRWDASLYLKVARWGYFTDAYRERHLEVFFPGEPGLVRLAHFVVPNWIVAALLVSAVTGAIGCLALWRLAAAEAGPAAGDAAVLALVAMPYAVFLFAGYSESVFLGFAVPAWLAATRSRWRDAGLLGVGAALTRITAVPLLLGLGVRYLTGPRPEGARRLRPDALWLALPAGALACYLGYLWAETGRPDAYARALEAGWGRRSVNPLDGFRTTWFQAGNESQRANYLWSWRVEIAAVLLGLLLAVVLLCLRRWGEATFVGSNAAMLATSSYYASGARAVLVWFPLYVLLGRLFARHPAGLRLYLCVCAPLAAVFTLAFTRGAWVA